MALPSPPMAAVRYVAIELRTLSSGACSYAFALEIRRPGAQPCLLRQRYSELRSLALAVQAQHPFKAAELPPFPKKHSLTRQSPSFLVRRGRALAHYLQALLADEQLRSLEDVERALRDATPVGDSANVTPPESARHVGELDSPRRTMSPSTARFDSPRRASRGLESSLEEGANGVSAQRLLQVEEKERRASEERQLPAEGGSYPMPEMPHAAEEGHREGREEDHLYQLQAHTENAHL